MPHFIGSQKMDPSRRQKGRGRKIIRRKRRKYGAESCCKESLDHIFFIFTYLLEICWIRNSKMALITSASVQTVSRIPCISG